MIESGVPTVCFADALKREFIERMVEWAKRNRRDLWDTCKGDPKATWSAITSFEDATVHSTDLPFGSGRIWLTVGGELIMGVSWAFSPEGKLVLLDWHGFDPLERQRKAGHRDGGRRKSGAQDVN